MAALIKGGRLLDGKGGALDNAVVLVQDSWIVAVGSQDAMPAETGVGCHRRRRQDPSCPA